MKTSYYRRRNVFFSSPTRIVAAGAFVLIVLGFILRLLVPSFFFSITEPLFSIGNTFSAPTEEAQQIQADRALLNENIALAEQVKDLMRLVGDEASVRSGIVAGVSARPPLAPYDTLIVGRGAEQGVTYGSLVSAEGGVLVGTIEMVGANHAQVALFSTGGRVTEGWVGDERVPISLTGEGGGAFTATTARDAGITEGALVYLPGPGARPVGSVVRVDADPSSPEATLRIKPMVNIFSLTLVLIETPS